MLLRARAPQSQASLQLISENSEAVTQSPRKVLRRARAELARLFTKVIRARRAANLKEEDAPADVLQSFITARSGPACRPALPLYAFAPAQIPVLQDGPGLMQSSDLQPHLSA